MEAVEAPTRKKRRPRRDSESTSSYPLPTLRPFQLCTLATTIPTGENWLFEMKFDGYRAQIAISGSDVRVYTRNGHNWTEQFKVILPPLAGVFQIAAENLRAMTIVLETRAAVAKKVTAPAALNRARLKARRTPVSDYHEVDLSRVRGPNASELSEAAGPGKRLHFRRGHVRRLEDGSETWVKWTLAGNPDLGFIDKRYRL